MEGRTFTTREEVITAVRDHYRSLGQEIKIGKNSDKKKLILQCPSGGKYQSASGETPKRERSTKKSDCPFAIRAFFSSVSNNWRIHTVFETHNHELSQGYAENRRLTDAEKSVVRSMAANGVPVAAIRSSLQSEFQNRHSTRKTIHNEIGKARKEILDGRTPIVALYEVLQDGNCFLRLSADENEEVIGLFMAHPISISMARRFSTIFMMDCTYKTNRYKMPMLNIIGISSTFSTFNIGFAFLKAETEEFYCWALRALEEIAVPEVVTTDRELALLGAIRMVFPNTKNLLCQWHINKNVTGHASTIFADEENRQCFYSLWRRCIMSNTEAEFDLNWTNIGSFSTSSDWQAAVDYLREVWFPYLCVFQIFFNSKNIF